MFACSSAILQGSLGRKKEWAGQGGGGQGSGGGPPQAACSRWGVPWAWRPRALLSSSPPQYFSTLENSIVSLFVLLTTAK